MESSPSPTIKKRERNSNRFVLCFKPFSMEDGVDSVKPVRTNSGAGDLVSIGKNKKNNSSNKNLKILVSSSSAAAALSDQGSIVSDERGSGRKKKSKIARVLKAVLFDTKLAKKISKKKSRKNMFRSSSNSTSTTNITDSIVNEKSTPRASSSDEDPDHRRINSNISSSMTSTITSTSLRSSASSSSIASISRSTSDRKGSFRSTSTNSNSATETLPSSSSPKQRENLTYGLCFLLVSLLVLILWGKVCAIFCTSAWFFFVPRRNIGCDSPVNVVGSPPAMDSVEYKKKVIMGGLLERNRTRMPVATVV